MHAGCAEPLPVAHCCSPQIHSGREFLPRGSACPGPVRARDVISGLSRAQRAWQSGSPYGDGSFVYRLSVQGPSGPAGLCHQLCWMPGAESSSCPPQHPAPVSRVPPLHLLTLIHLLLRVNSTVFFIHLQIFNFSTLLNISLQRIKFNLESNAQMLLTRKILMSDKM